MRGFWLNMAAIFAILEMERTAKVRWRERRLVVEDENIWLPYVMMVCDCWMVGLRLQAVE